MIKVLKKINVFWIMFFLVFVYLCLDQNLFFDIYNQLSMFYLWVQSLFNLVGDFDSDWFVWVPFIFVCSLMILGMLIYPEPPEKLRICAVVVLAVVHTLYISFRTFNSFMFDSFSSLAVTIFLWICEVMFYVCSLSLYVQLVFSISRKSVADKYEKDVKNKKYFPVVNVFIPTYSESVEIIRRTVVGCQSMEYESKQIYILDDGNRSQIKSLAEELNCSYISREKNVHAKAGNINNALSQTNGELVVIFDADCVPTKNFLSRTVGFFQEKDMALVITAQSFYNADVFSHNVMSLLEQSKFFRCCQKGRDKFNALLCYGTCFIVRRSALEDIGGIPTETLSEDWATSIKLQAKGYKTYMLDEVLGAGAVAESIGEYVKQRVRWTQGTLQSLYASTNPFKIKGLTFMQRLIHSHSIFHYLLNPFYVFIIIIPVFYFLFGFMPFSTTRGQMWFFFIPFMCMNFLTFSWISREYSSRLSSFICESFMSVPLSWAAIRTLFKPFGRKFRITQKGLLRDKSSINWFVGAPLVFFLILLILSVFYGYKNMHWYGSEEIFYFLLFWTVLRIFGVWIGIYASFDFIQQRRSVRFNHRYASELIINGQDPEKLIGMSEDISENGLLIKVKDKLQNLKNGVLASLTIEKIGLENVLVKVERVNGNYLAVSFDKLGLNLYRKLVEFLYCRPGQWEYNNGIDQKVLAALKKSIFFEGIRARCKR